MSASSSNLDSAKYGYDLVCATTQDAINVTMKEFLAQFTGTEFSSCYVFDPTSKGAVTVPLATLQSEIGQDPFTIPNGADQSNPAVQALYNNKFLYAFRTKLGIPSGLAPAAVPDIVILNKGNAAVSYQLFCAEFEIIELQQNFGNLSFNSYTQAPTAPWIFLFEVNINLEGVDFTKLPCDVQDQVKNLSGDSAFSVQQLYLDLNTAGMQQLPKIVGLDPTSDAYIEITKVFINQYWNTLKTGTEGAILGYIARPTGAGSSPSITPTDLTLEVSPNLDAKGNPTTNYGLYTLNYLVMSQNRTMPPAVPFAWNWVEAQDEANFHGIMAVRSDIFRSFIQTLVTPELQKLNFVSQISLSHSGMTFY